MNSNELRHNTCNISPLMVAIDPSNRYKPFIVATETDEIFLFPELIEHICIKGGAEV
jgi:hypothetical protein